MQNEFELDADSIDEKNRVSKFYGVYQIYITSALYVFVHVYACNTHAHTHAHMHTHTCTHMHAHVYYFLQMIRLLNLVVERNQGNGDKG